MSVRDRSGQARDDLVVARLHELAPHLDGEPEPAFRAATRARLVAMAAVRTPGPEPATGLERLLAARARVAPSRWRSRLTAGLAGAAMAVTAMATLVAVSTDARPGDALYGVKQGTEQTQLALAGDARGQTLLDFASTRLEELVTLVDEGPSALPVARTGPAVGTVLAAGVDSVLVLETLRTMDEQTTEGAAWLAGHAVRTEDPEPLDDLAAWTADQGGTLAALAPRLPDDAADEARTSLVLLADITTRATGLRSALDCAGGPAVSGADSLGPVPVVCGPERAATSPGGGTGSSTAPVPGTPSGSLPPATTTDAVPQPGGGTDPAEPAPGSGSGSSSGSGAGGAEVPTASLPRPSLPSLPVPLPVPPIPQLPGQNAGSNSSPVPPPVIDVPPAPVPLCLPPLATLGDC
jgi:hypothetical protein